MADMAFPPIQPPSSAPAGHLPPCGGKVCLSAWGLSRVVSWSALILQRHKKAHLSAGFQVVEKGHIRQILCKSLAEFRRPQTTESSTVCFFRGHVPRKKHCSGRKRASEASAMQRPASFRKNACIFERACRLCRQAQRDTVYTVSLFCIPPRP